MLVTLLHGFEKRDEQWAPPEMGPIRTFAARREQRMKELIDNKPNDKDVIAEEVVLEKVKQPEHQDLQHVAISVKNLGICHSSAQT